MYCYLIGCEVTSSIQDVMYYSLALPAVEVQAENLYVLMFLKPTLFKPPSRRTRMYECHIIKIISNSPSPCPHNPNIKCCQLVCLIRVVVMDVNDSPRSERGNCPLPEKTAHVCRVQNTPPPKKLCINKPRNASRSKAPAMRTSSWKDERFNKEDKLCLEGYE